MESLYRDLLLDKFISLGMTDVEVMSVIDELDKQLVGPYVYNIVWENRIPVSIKPVLCDDFLSSGIDTWIAFREGKFLSAHSYHQFLDCRLNVRRERQLNILIGDD